jgi:hypothetical protein
MSITPVSNTGEDGVAFCYVSLGFASIPPTIIGRAYGSDAGSVAMPCQ